VDLEARLRIQPVHALVIHGLAGLAHLQIDHPGPVPPVAVRQYRDLRPKRPIAIRGRNVPQGVALIRTTVKTRRSLSRPFSVSSFFTSDLLFRMIGL